MWNSPNHLDLTAPHSQRQLGNLFMKQELGSQRMSRAAAITKSTCRVRNAGNCSNHPVHTSAPVSRYAGLLALSPKDIFNSVLLRKKERKKIKISLCICDELGLSVVCVWRPTSVNNLLACVCVRVQAQIWLHNGKKKIRIRFLFYFFFLL